MAKIYYTGKCAKRKVELIDSLIKFSLNKMMPKKHSHLTIDIEFEKDFMGDAGAAAAFSCNENCYMDFTIEIDPSLKLRNILLAVAHEIVHIKQFATGQGCVKTQSVIHTNDNNNKDNCWIYDEYWDDPLEIEAYGRERGLVIRWLVHTGNNKKAWAQDVLEACLD